MLIEDMYKTYKVSDGDLCMFMKEAYERTGYFMDLLVLA